MQEKYVSAIQPTRKARPGRPQNARPTLGLLMRDTAASWELSQWKGVVDAARERDVNLICFPGRNLREPGSFHAQANVLYDLCAEKTDGLIIFTGALGQYVNQEELEEFCKHFHPLPVVSVERAIGGIPTVFQGDYQSMRVAMVHLIEDHGYRHIAFIGGILGHLGHQERYRAYVDTLAEYGLPFDSNLVFPPTVSDDFAAITRWLLTKRKTDFNAVVGVSDMQALLAMQTLRAQGMRIPEDVAVVGFDNYAEARAVMPPLTTVQPSFYEIGQKAVEIALALITGEQVPEQVTLPGRLVVRESCGCSLAPVLQATVEEVTASGETLDAALAGHRERILSAMTAGVGIPIAGLDPQWATRLLDGLVADLTDSSNRQSPAGPNKATPGAFVRALDETLRRVADAGGDLGAWQGVLSELRRHTLPCLVGDAHTLYRADDLWGQARVLIGERVQRVQANQAFQAEQQANVLREIGQGLIATFDVEALTDVLAQGLPRLGIPSGYLSLYEDSKVPAEWSKLVMAYNEKGCVELEAGRRRFPSRQLAPEGLMPQDRSYCLLVEPLYFRENQIGFALFEVGPREGAVYETLRAQISSALQGAMLVQRGERRSTQLQTAAEVSRATSSILDLDELLSQTVELIRDRFGLYYAGLFLVDQTGEWTGELGKWAVLRAGTGEAGQKMLAAGHKLEVGGSSMVGWCIANRQARIALDVGEEAVRFSNPLLPHTRSELALPLVSRGQVIGAMTAQSDLSAAFTQEDITTLQSMADQLANAIENARLFTEHKQAEEVLARERNLLRALIDNIPDRIYAKDTESRFIICNVASVRRMGKTSPDELVGKSDFDLVPRELAERFYADEQAVIRSGQPLLNREEPLETVDGKITRWNLATKVPLRDSQGNIIGIVGLGREITDLKQSQLKLERNALQLRTAAEVSRAASSLLTLDELLPQVVELIRDRFDLYYVGLFLVDETGQHAVLQAGMGAGSAHEAGQKMLEAHHQVAVGGTSMVGWCIANRQARIALDVGQDAMRLANRLLPETRSEMALPLISRGQAIGGLTIQSSQAAAFTEEDTIILQTMAGQVANAIENARLYERAQTALKEMEATQRRYVQKAWAEYLSSVKTTRYETGRPGSAPLGDAVLPEIQQAVEQQSTVVLSGSGDTERAAHLALVTPITLRGSVIGVLGIHDDQETRQWTAEEIALVEAVTERMAQAAENLRLFDEAQRRAARERLIGEVTARIRGSATMEGILNAAVREIGQVTGASSAAIDLELVETDGSQAER